ncbi:MAG: hypothetical protein C0518_11190 [Opitutus sp.]|nr:hypothetical protein [Opitutus sp.]
MKPSSEALPLHANAGQAIAFSVARHSFGWFVAANLVGVWLAVLLLWPAAGDWAAPLTYGRWMPLHLDWQLYGWTALPTAGLLLIWFLDARDPRALFHARLALGAWSLALALGGVSWLAGDVSGKLFLDWSGLARPLLPAAMLVLWGVLARHTMLRWPTLAKGERLARVGLLVLLLPVPEALYWSMGREVYPSVNPDSGGATGSALLGSTLGIVSIFLLLPFLLRLPRTMSGIRRDWIGAFLALSWVAYVVIDHGNTSHHAAAQIVGLGLLLAWIPLLGIFWFSFEWPPAARAWLWAALTWWALLVASGWAFFLPGISEALKFTHALVGHTHLAVAGLITSLNAALLGVLTKRPAPRGVFTSWQAGTVIYVASMLALGAVETERAGDLFRSEGWTQALFGLRLAGGALMTFASLRRLLSFWTP